MTRRVLYDVIKCVLGLKSNRISPDCDGERGTECRFWPVCKELAEVLEKLVLEYDDSGNKVGTARPSLDYRANQLQASKNKTQGTGGGYKALDWYWNWNDLRRKNK